MSIRNGSFKFQWSLRFDHRWLGDSCCNFTIELNSLYPSSETRIHLKGDLYRLRWSADYLIYLVDCTRMCIVFGMVRWWNWISLCSIFYSCSHTTSTAKTKNFNPKPKKCWSNMNTYTVLIVGLLSLRCVYF